MRSIVSHLILRIILKSKLLKIEKLKSLNFESLLSRLIFTKSELQLIACNTTYLNKADLSLSVVVIHHDPIRLPWLIECMYSLDSQFYKNFETILVINYEISTEIKNLVEKFNNVEVFYFKNSHPSQARNFGVQKSNNPLILFVDDDNLLFPWHLLFFANAYQNHPDAEIFFGSYFCFENETVTDYPLRYLLNRTTLLLGDPTDVSSLAVKKSSFPTILWDDQVLSENWAFLVDAFDVGLKVHQMFAPLSLHRKHSESRSKKIERPLIPSEWFEKYRNQVDWDLKIPQSTINVKRLKMIHAFRTFIEP